MNIRKRTWEIVEAAKAGDTASRIFDIAILALIFLNVIAVIIGSIQSVQKRWGVFLNVFEAISVAEKQHEKRYRDLARNIEKDQVFKRGDKTVWRCRNCGYLHEGTEAPELCPACIHPQAHFEILGENW